MASLGPLFTCFLPMIISRRLHSAAQRLGTASALKGAQLTDDQNSPSPPEGTLSHCTCAQEAIITKRRKKFGSSVAYKTIGTFLSKSETQRCQWVGH